MPRSKPKKAKTILPFQEYLQRITFFIAHHYKWFLVFFAILGLKMFAPAAFSIFLIAFVFYVIFHPIVFLLNRLFKNPKVSIIVFLVFFSGLLFLAGKYLIPALFSQIFEFSKFYPSIQDQVIKEIKNLQTKYHEISQIFYNITRISTDEFFNQILNQTGQSILRFLNGIVGSFSGIFTKILQIIIGLIASIYLLFEQKKISDFFILFLEKDATTREKKFLALAYEKILAYFSGMLLLALISFVCHYLFLFLLKIKFSLLLGLWTGVMEFIPIIGPILALFAVLLAVWIQHPALLLIVLIFYLVFQFLMSYLIAPPVLGKKTELSPLMIFIILLIGGEVYGIPGMIFSIPLASILVIFWKIYSNRI